MRVGLLSCPFSHHVASQVRPDLCPWQLIAETKSRLGAEYADLKVGRGGRDDEGLLVWFLKDRKYNVEAAVTKVARFIVSTPPSTSSPSRWCESVRVSFTASSLRSEMAIRVWRRWYHSGDDSGRGGVWEGGAASLP